MNAPTTGVAPRPRSGAPLPDDLRSKLSAMVAQLGEHVACERIGVNRATFARALAGLGVQRGTETMIRVALAQIPDSGAAS